MANIKRALNKKAELIAALRKEKNKSF